MATKQITQWLKDIPNFHGRISRVESRRDVHLEWLNLEQSPLFNWLRDYADYWGIRLEAEDLETLKAKVIELIQAVGQNFSSFFGTAVQVIA
jgi:hypothetical protein